MPRSKLAPTRPGREYMRRETPIVLFSPWLHSLDLSFEPWVNQEPGNLLSLSKSSRLERTQMCERQYLTRCAADDPMGRPAEYAITGDKSWP